MALTLFEKIWARHVVAEGPGGQRCSTSTATCCTRALPPRSERLARSGRRVRRPDLSFATADHYVLTSPGAPAPDPEIARDGGGAARRTRPSRGSSTSASGDVRRGIVHVIGPEQGLTLPGMLLVCGDSHTGDPRRARRAGVRHRLERGRARAGHADALAAQAQDAARSRSTGGCAAGVTRQGRDPRPHRADRRRRRRRPRHRVRGLDDPRACRWTSA